MYRTFISLVIYRLVSAILFLPAVAFTLFTSIKYRDFRYLRQRLGLAYPEFSASICLHCASVGEVNTSLPLLRLLASSASLPVIVTTNTITAYKVIARNSAPQVTHVYLPLDFSVFVRSFLDSVRPVSLLIVETELWPVLLQEGLRRQIRQVIINGRISSRTLRSPRWLRDVYRQTLSAINHIFARSSNDAESFQRLGASAEQCSVMPDLKFSWDANPVTQDMLPLSSAYLLCVSTHEDEELLIAAEWWRRRPDLDGLVIAPRHPNRIQQICRTLTRHNIPYFLHSTQQGNSGGVYLIDTVGELDVFMQHADMIFIGGSLVKRGGHNVLEAARYQKCPFIGPYYSNFTAVVDSLKTAAAVRIVQDAGQLLSEYVYFKHNSAERNVIGQRAFEFATQKACIHKQYYQILNRIKLFQPPE